MYHAISFRSYWNPYLQWLLATERVGKDDVRLLSLTVLQRRIEELKVDSEQQDQDALIRGIYAIRKFCLDKKANVFLVSDRVLQEPNGIRDLMNRLLDYRIIHSVGSALTHKSTTGTFNAYMIDGVIAKHNLGDAGPVVDAQMDPPFTRRWSSVPELPGRPRQFPHVRLLPSLILFFSS